MDRFLKQNDLADLFGVTRRCIDQWRRDGKLPPHFVIGDTRYWKASELLAFIEQRRNAATVRAKQ
jgi:predicted DNA-binding transcriptional regulator AlpA